VFFFFNNPGSSLAGRPYSPPNNFLWVAFFPPFAFFFLLPSLLAVLEGHSSCDDRVVRFFIRLHEVLLYFFCSPDVVFSFFLFA